MKLTTKTSAPCAAARSQQSLSSLVDLYHSSATFITKENLDAVIDVEFAPVSGTPQTRPQMASLIDLHLEMNDPGFYSRPENDWRRIAEESAAASSMTPTTTTSAAAGVNPAFSNLAGTSLENALPHRAGSTTTATDLSQRTNDWVGARERELTPRQRLVVQALYGTTADRRPGLEGISERLGQESELEQDERRQFVARQEQILSDVGEETIALKTEPIHLEPWDGPAPEADAVASEGLAEGGDVAFEEILPKEGEQAKP